MQRNTGANLILALEPAIIVCKSDAARRVNLNAYAERWVRSVKEECGSSSLASAPCGAASANTSSITMLSAIIRGKDNVLLFPRDASVCRTGPVQCRERLGGLLTQYRCS